MRTALGPRRRQRLEIRIPPSSEARAQFLRRSNTIERLLLELDRRWCGNATGSARARRRRSQPVDEEARDGHECHQHLVGSMLRLRRSDGDRGAAVNTPRQKASESGLWARSPEAFRDASQWPHAGRGHRLRRSHRHREVPRGPEGFHRPQLGAMVVREAVRRAGIDPASVEECLMGNVVSAGTGQAPARQAALGGELSDHVSQRRLTRCADRV